MIEIKRFDCHPMMTTQVLLSSWSWVPLNDNRLVRWSIAARFAEFNNSSDMTFAVVLLSPFPVGTSDLKSKFDRWKRRFCCLIQLTTRRPISSISSVLRICAHWKTKLVFFSCCCCCSECLLSSCHNRMLINCRVSCSNDVLFLSSSLFFSPFCSSAERVSVKLSSSTVGRD